MTTPTRDEIRKKMLEVVARLEKGGGAMEHAHVLREIADLVPRHEKTPEYQRMALSQWNELFRTGYLGLGMNLDNPGVAWFQVTDRGKRAIDNLSRDPANPAGYKGYIQTVATLNSVSESYLHEALDCFAAGHFKAAAVMIGGAVESLTLELRDAVKTAVVAGGAQSTKGLDNWMISIVIDEVAKILDACRGGMPRELRDDYDAYWSGFVHQIRITRNSAGHPTSIAPVTEDAAHCMFLMFPMLAKLADRLRTFALAGFK